jgi:hypothetical protein
MGDDGLQESLEQRVEAFRIFPEGRVTNTLHHMSFALEEQLDVQARQITEFDKRIPRAVYEGNGYVRLFDRAALIDPPAPSALRARKSLATFRQSVRSRLEKMNWSCLRSRETETGPRRGT